ncbi:pre-B-cell leukemia transcription factor-interacting protein 1 [Synchiropus splendidus]|uniref:pre-B-cell leukemia transcription factor-interacting protein 1 n=1 Tax=Synchiropus splendidus TaxID=270530 RepID=UPI00237DF9BB|nr:pre-B-cell leukemia transcription factor-interacting protein 1 [Synchiropus splendidus]XP_053719159.1 pre-B-cell leukemia transcription factor-interacting protein 1 [Synchiropus splendidus]XP_053719160.1 pre-B-cell leukemia transcription factor-interacting protein 1 [Synchiropus splendidus]XP_053719161.1 pre-B-cell leukemia transcription factor-interacting protein 1 [Synchiropus splendidus]
MSDHSHSAGSSGSSSNSWTLLSPEEAGVENVGQVDDGTESLGDAPSLSEDLAGAAVEFKPVDIPVETVLSEEGHQVCQETSPDSSEGPVPSSPSHRSALLHTPDLPDLDQESQPPIIHDIVTSSPSDIEPLGATSFVTNVDFDTAADFHTAEPEECSAVPPVTDIAVSAESEVDVPADPPANLTEATDVTPEVDTEIVAEAIPYSPPHAEPVLSTHPDEKEPLSVVPEHPGGPESMSVDAAESEEIVEDKTSEKDEPNAQEETAVETVVEEETGVEEVIKETAAEETAKASDVGRILTEGDVEDIGAEEVAVEDATERLPEHDDAEDQLEDEEEIQEQSASFDHSSSFDDGLRRRNLPPFDGPRPRTSDEEEEEEELEFKLAEKTPEKPWFSVNKCIVGALVLLFLGSLFLSGDFDASELSDGEQSQDVPSSDPQDMKELLAKLTQENQQIALLEAQLQAQKAELDSALKAVAASGDEKSRANLEAENLRLKEELTSLPGLKTELQSLRSRVTELSQLTVDAEVAPAMSVDEKDGNHVSFSPERKKESGDKLKQELQRQKNLLEESKKRLQGMRKDGGDRKGVRDSLEEIHKKLSEHVERWGKKNPQESKWKGSKEEHKSHWKKEEKKEWRGEKERKPSKEGEWKEREDRKEKDWKSQKQNSHKESWRKHQDEWERKKGERRMDREERRKEKPWQGRAGKNAQKQQQQQRKPDTDSKDFWTHQEQKLRRNIRPQVGCSSVEDCATKEGLYPVELPEFEELLEGYMSKLVGTSIQSKDKIRKLMAEFFEDGVFIHDRILFSDFAEDVADILEDMVDFLAGPGQKGDDSLEEEMEEFEREALWKFAATS